MRIDTETLKRARPDVWSKYLTMCAEHHIKPLPYNAFFAALVTRIYRGTPAQIEIKVNKVIAGY